MLPNQSLYQKSRVIAAKMPAVYHASDDSFLLEECIRTGDYAGRWAIDIGTGSGILLHVLSERFENVVATDIDLNSLRVCNKDVWTENTNVMFVCCSAASAIRARFDLVVSNPPYLPDEKDGIFRDAAVHGGRGGTEATAEFVKSALPLLATDGRILLVVSSFADQRALDAILAEKGLVRKKVKEKRIFYETLSVIELTRNGNGNDNE
jgi:release factor glutamine methyltransferase